MTDAFGVVAMVAMTPLITAGAGLGLPATTPAYKERDLSADKIPVEAISVAELFENLKHRNYRVIEN